MVIKLSGFCYNVLSQGTVLGFLPVNVNYQGTVWGFLISRNTGVKMKKTTVIFALLFAFCSISFAETKSTREEVFKDNSIALEADLDGDGKDEIVARMRDISSPLKIFYLTGKKYKQTESNLITFHDTGISSSGISYLALKKGKGMLLVLYTPLGKLIEGRGWYSGNAIIAAEFKKHKINVIMDTYSDYGIYVGPNPHDIENQENTSVKLGREPYHNVITNDRQDEILFQSENNSFFLNSNLEFEKTEIKIPQYASIYAYKRNGDDFQYIYRGADISNRNQFGVRKEKYNQTEIYDIPIERGVLGIAYGDTEDTFIVEYGKNLILHKLVLRKVGNVTEVVEDKIIEKSEIPRKQ